MNQRTARPPRSPRSFVGITALLWALVLSSIAFSVVAEEFVPTCTTDYPDADLEDDVCDTGRSECSCTLRAAVMQANATDGADIITLKGAEYVLRAEGPLADAEGGDLDLTEGLTIRGERSDGPGLVTIRGQAGWQDRIFHSIVPPDDSPVILSRLNLTRGNLNVTGGDGAGLLVESGRVEIRQSTIELNFALLGRGAGLAVTGGTVLLDQSRVFDNLARSGAGVAVLGNSAVVEMRASTVAYNSATETGGGFELDGGLLVVRNGTISDNSASDVGGGGCVRAGLLRLLNGTVAYNRVLSGAGGGIASMGPQAAVDIVNSLVSSNEADTDPDVSGTILASFSLFGQPDTPSIVGSNNVFDPGEKGRLARLQLIGDDLTETVPLLLDSLALEAGNGGLAPDLSAAECELTDQRGSLRVVVGTQDCDAGAFEGCTDLIDADDDGLGDQCDPCPDDPTNDADGDAICGGARANCSGCSAMDNCPIDANDNQADRDGDGRGDECEVVLRRLTLASSVSVDPGTSETYVLSGLLSQQFTIGVSAAVRCPRDDDGDGFVDEVFSGVVGSGFWGMRGGGLGDAILRGARDALGGDHMYWPDGFAPYELEHAPMDTATTGLVPLFTTKVSTDLLRESVDAAGSYFYCLRPTAPGP